MSETAGWKPTGKYLLVKLHTVGSVLELQGDVQYNGLATVLAAGPDVAELSAGDVVVINGPQGIVSHKEFGENVAIVPTPLVLARRVEG